MIIYSNSCSYGVDSDGPVYSEFISKNFNCELVNHGIGGGCNERIFRTSVRDILNILEHNSRNDILVLIGLTNTFRGEYWSLAPSLHQDGHFKSFTAVEISGVAKKYQQALYKIYDQEAAITNLLTQLVMFTGFLKDQQIKYLIWSNSQHLKPIDFTMDFIKPFYQHISKDSNILSLFDFNFCDFSKKNGYPTMDKPYDQGGHPNTHAHKHFAEFLMTKINF